MLCVSLCFGGHGDWETPGYIPNPEAKPYSADGTAGGTLWESRTPPNNYWAVGPGSRKTPGPTVFFALSRRRGKQVDPGL